MLGEQHHHLHRHRGRHLAHPHQDHVRGRLVGVQLLEAVVELIKSGEFDPENFGLELASETSEKLA